MYSIVIPARDEENNLAETVREIVGSLESHGIDYEIVVVNDSSRDGTGAEIERMHAANSRVRRVDNPRKPGIGNAIHSGIDAARGDCISIVMADASDAPEDIIRYYRMIEEGYECVFGSRFMPGGGVAGYPPHKLVLNRIVNTGIRILFALRYNDVTNAFKCYRRDVVDGIRPIISRHFNITVELPLKAIVRGYRYAVIPIKWRGRKNGESRLKLKEMGSRYLFIILYIYLEKLLSRGDYLRPVLPEKESAA